MLKCPVPLLNPSPTPNVVPTVARINQPTRHATVGTIRLERLRLRVVPDLNHMTALHHAPHLRPICHNPDPHDEPEEQTGQHKHHAKPYGRPSRTWIVATMQLTRVSFPVSPRPLTRTLLHRLSRLARPAKPNAVSSTPRTLRHRPSTRPGEHFHQVPTLFHARPYTPPRPIKQVKWMVHELVQSSGLQARTGLACYPCTLG
jgi:hypothetical protein